MRRIVLTLMVFGIVVATTGVGNSAERRSGGYIYTGPAKERLEPYLEKLHLLKMDIEKKQKELKELEQTINKRRLELAVLETKIATMEKMRHRLYFRRDFDIYVVKEGDCLWKIAGKDEVYGDPGKWEMIYTANRDVIDDPHTIYPGQILIIPRLKE